MNIQNVSGLEMGGKFFSKTAFGLFQISRSVEEEIGSCMQTCIYYSSDLCEK
jgi:hypothetical protein